MPTVEKIQAEIESLSQKDFSRLRTWFIEKIWNQWDDEIEKDVSSGKLDFLQEEARTAKSQNTLGEL
ncbi:MAG TPA: hypothetical protein VI603_04600 [Saprospiraceae bacterium]|nr:hypothetical protein [Saprospiraceae bacterium]